MNEQSNTAIPVSPLPYVSELLKQLISIIKIKISVRILN